jgi:hypothetical protein
MKLFLILHDAVGLVAAVSHPLPDLDKCRKMAANIFVYYKDHPEFQTLTARCEHHSKAPKLTSKIDERVPDVNHPDRALPHASKSVRKKREP